MSTTVNDRPETGPRQIAVQIEALLIDWAVPYDYDPAFPIEAARRVKGTQVREEAHQYDRDTAEQYAAFMREDVTFPPIIVYGDDIVVDGNTRIAAAKLAKRPTVPAFKCRFPNADLAVAFAGTINQMGGRRLTTDEAHGVASTLIAAGYSDEAVARSVGYGRTQVGNWRRENEARTHAERTRVADVAERLNKSTLRKLAEIKQDAPFAAAVKLAAEVQPSASQFKDLVRAVTSAPSEADALEAVAQARSEMQPSGPPPHRAAMTDEVRTAKRVLPQLVNLAGRANLLLAPGDTEWVERWTVVRQLADEVIALHSHA